MNFGERLLLLLDEKELSQKQFADALDITYSTFNGYIKNKRECDFETLKRIALQLNTSIDYLLGVANHPHLAHHEPLTHDESELIAIYRQLSSEYQILLLEQSKVMQKQLHKTNEK